MDTLLFFIIGMLLTASIASIDAICPYDRMARSSLIEIAKRIQSNQPEGGDSDDSSSVDRSDAYKLNGTKWRKNHITYKIIQYSRKLSKSVVNDAVRRAFKLWSDVTNLTFEEIPHRSWRKSDIRIAFVPKIDDGVSGRSGGPYYSGNLELGDNINWSVDATWGTNLREVVAHEIGHALGLSHSTDYHSIMFAKERTGYDPHCGLGSDDIKAIQILYGTPKSSFKSPGLSSNIPGRLGTGRSRWFSDDREIRPKPLPVSSLLSTTKDSSSDSPSTDSSSSSSSSSRSSSSQSSSSRSSGSQSSSSRSSSSRSNGSQSSNSQSSSPQSSSSRSSGSSSINSSTGGSSNSSSPDEPCRTDTVELEREPISIEVS